MKATTINTKTVPTAEAIQEALAFLRNLADQKPSGEDDGGKDEPNPFISSSVFKTIEAALKSTAEAKAASDEAEPDEGEKTVRGKKHAACAADEDDDEEDEDVADDDDDNDDNDDDNDEDDNPFAGDYYWCPGPEWKTIGLVAGGAALVGLGALLYKMLDD